MIITANFTNNGLPQDGLTPTIRIINLPNIVDISGAAMIEVTDLSGTYYYDFIAYNVSGNYQIRCDGGISLSDYDRYTWATNTDDLEIGTGITKIINDLDSPTQYMANVTGINDLSGYIAPIQVDLNTPSQYMAVITGLSLDGEYDSVISGIQAEVDKPDQFKADVSALGTPANFMANVTGINDLSGYIAPMAVDLNTPNQYKADVSSLATSGVVATIGVNIDSIKTKTDNLPIDTSGQIAIIQGLLHKNLYTTTYWDGDDMTGAQIRLYDSAFNAGVHSASGLLLTLGLTGTFAAGKTQTILVIEE